MNTPGFTAEMSFRESPGSYLTTSARSSVGMRLVPQFASPLRPPTYLSRCLSHCDLNYSLCTKPVLLQPCIDQLAFVGDVGTATFLCKHKCGNEHASCVHQCFLSSPEASPNDQLALRVWMRNIILGRKKEV